VRDPPVACDPLAAYPHAQTSLCHATCPFVDDTLGDHLDPAPGRVVLRVTVDPPDVSVRRIAWRCANGAETVPFVARSADAIDLAPAGARCCMTATEKRAISPGSRMTEVVSVG
jgi:hypothetical protein